MTPLTVDGIFTDHMVLMHSRKNPVWGTASPGSEVRLSLGEYECICTTDEDGRWRADIETPPAGTITKMRIDCGDESIVFSDVASGEVWLAGGQSNMEMPMLAVNDAKKFIFPKEYPDIRLRTIPRRCSEQAQYGWHFQPLDGSDPGWVLPEKESVARFSAIAYAFTAFLSEALAMPVGIIDCDWGGTRIQSWMDRSELASCGDTLADIENFQKKHEALGDRAHTAFQDYQTSLRRVIDEYPDFVDRMLDDPRFAIGLERLVKWPEENADFDPNEPGVLFTHMVKYVAPYGIRGVLWYQGESNALQGESARYRGLFERMRRSWQDVWGCSLPFLTCQLATFDPFRWGNGYDWVTLREQQELCADTMPGVSMAVLVDVGEERDIHPHEKIPVARRLLDLALRDVYHLPVADVFPPKPVRCVHQEQTLVLTFDAPVEIRAGKTSFRYIDENGQEAAPACNPSCVDERTLAFHSTNAIGIAYGRREWFTATLFGTNGAPVAPFAIRAK